MTRFDFRTFKQGNVWGGSLYYFGDSFSGQLEALANELNKPDASQETHLMISMGFAAMFGPNIMCLNRESSKSCVYSPICLDFPLRVEVPARVGSN